MTKPSHKDKAKSGAGRVVLHIDMNAFYCSVHAAVEPEKYQDRATAVSGSVELRKGIIVTSSYPARARGVATGMHVREALQRCPDLLLIRPDFDLYRQFSHRFLDVVRQYTPLVEVVSIDECYADITGSGIFGDPLSIAREIQHRIQTECGLPCSIGIGPNKLLAKMASDMEKPNGLTVLRIRDVPRHLWTKPSNALFGIGKKTAQKLKTIGIHTIGELAGADDALLARTFGINGAQMKRSAHGRDDAPVNPNREPNKSVGHATTLPENLSAMDDQRTIEQIFLNLADQTCRRLRLKKQVAETVQITIRDPKMDTITRSITLQAVTDDTSEVYHEAKHLFDRHWPREKPVRLLGITLQNLKPKSEAPVQLDLFAYENQPKKEQLQDVIDEIRDKFGEDALLTAGMIGDDPASLIRDRKRRGTSLQIDHINEDHTSKK